MTRLTTLLGRTLATVAIALPLSCSAPATPPPALDGPPPNIVWLVLEDMSPWIACYGDDTVPTPHLDRLATESVRYEHAYATSPVCAAARSTILTGMYATRIGTMHHRTGKPSQAALDADPEAYAGIPSYEGVPPAFVRCFPETLRRAGYHCTNNAKTDYQFRAPVTTWDRSNGKAHWRDAQPDQPFFAVFNHGGTHESQAFPDAKVRPAVVAAEDVPVPPLYPDTPAVRDALARTYNNIAAMDAWVGGHLAALEDAGLLDETVVLVYADHGVGLPRGKRSPYDLGLRVPLLVRHPDGRGAGTVSARVVSFVDLAPSMLSLAGIAPDARLDGVPFLGPHKRDGTGLAFAHADRFDATRDQARSVTDGRFRLVRNLRPGLPHLLDNAYRNRLPMMADLAALRTRPDVASAQWQVASTHRPDEELYDSLHDPWEVVDLMDDAAFDRHRARLSGALDDWMVATGDLGLWPDEGAMVEARLWKGATQPATAKPVITVRDDGLVEITCATPGASLGYRTGESASWTPYSGPFDAPTDARLDVEAHRIGFTPARVTIDAPSSPAAPASTD